MNVECVFESDSNRSPTESRSRSRSPTSNLRASLVPGSAEQPA
jgi:hypothetical protein